MHTQHLSFAAPLPTSLIAEDVIISQVSPRRSLVSHVAGRDPPRGEGLGGWSEGGRMRRYYGWGGGGSVSFRGASPPIHPPLRSPPSLPSRGEEGWGEGILSSLGGDPIPSLPCQSVLRPPSPMTGPGGGGQDIAGPLFALPTCFSSRLRPSRQRPAHRFFIALLSISLANLDPLPAPSTTSGIHSV